MHPIKHFKTITHHRHLVIRHCFKAGLGFQGLRHDLSKYSPAEFLTGAKNYQGTRSPNEVDRELVGYSMAWLHHKGRNRHHFEYWTDYSPVEKKVRPVKMPFRYVAEMFCDRLAASKTYQGAAYTEQHPIDYFLRGKANRFIHKETSDELEYQLRLLAEKGETAVFDYIRRKIKSGEEY